MSNPTPAEQSLAIFNAKQLSIEIKFSAIKTSILGMLAENVQRSMCGHSPAYTSEAFEIDTTSLNSLSLILDEAIQHHIDTCKTKS